MAKRFRAKPWPWPGDSLEQRARRVAIHYRELAIAIATSRLELDPATAINNMDWFWADHGITWQQPTASILNPDEQEWMTAPDLAAAISRTRKDIYNWARLGHITTRAGPDGTPEYNVKTVLEYQQKLNTRRKRRSADAK